jgi:Tol biopolymer transport system component
MRRIMVLMVIGFSALVASAGLGCQSAQDLFQRALSLEREVGNLQEAIGLYEKVVSVAGQAELGARAQLRIGICYEKQGRGEAQKAFQRVIDNYPGQLDEVREAKERIARLAGATSETSGQPTFKKIQIPSNPGNGVFSPNGKKLAFASEGCLWVVPIPGNVDPHVAGTPVRLTGPIGVDNIDNTLAWSGDGQWIAFNTSRSERLADPNSIFMIPSAGGPVKKISIRPAGIPRARRLGLSPDAKILVFPHHDGIFALTVDSGEGRVLAEADGNLGIWGDPAFSPDGSKVAYIRYSRISPEKKRTVEEPKYSLWVADLLGDAPAKIVEMNGFLRGPAWSPDGTMIALIHNPSADLVNDTKLCIVPLNSRASSQNGPLLIDLPSAAGPVLAGWTPQNRIGVTLGNPPLSAVYTAPSSGGQAAQVSREHGSIEHPRWSPDGSRLFYRSQGGIFSVPSDGGPAVKVLAKATEAKRDGPYEATSGGGNNVSPDGKNLVFSGALNLSKPGESPFRFEVNIYTIPAGGGQPTKLTAFPWDPEHPRNGQARFPCWSPDGKTIAFTFDHLGQEGKPVWDIFTVPATGGEVRQISSASDQVAYAGIDWSPDGKWIAYYSMNKAVRLLPVEGGPAKSLTDVADIRAGVELSWSPEGERIAYLNNGRIYTIPAAGGPPVELKTGLDPNVYEAYHLSWSPDGKTIAFAATRNEPAELHLVEDFMPLLKTGRK